MRFSFEDIVSGLAQSIGDVFAVTWWFFVPIILFLVFLAAWLFYVRKKNLESIKWVLLKITPPREVQKTPKAMEQVFQLRQARSWGSDRLRTSGFRPRTCLDLYFDPCDFGAPTPPYMLAWAFSFHEPPPHDGSQITAFNYEAAFVKVRLIGRFREFWHYKYRREFHFAPMML